MDPVDRQSWKRLSGLDLRQLEYLRVLVEEAHVSRAAARLGISQPTLSIALAKLRTLFNDPLLVRGQNGMYPSNYAVELVELYRRLAASMEEAMVRYTSFDPGMSQRTFDILSNDYVASTVGSEVMTHLRRVAPGVHVELSQVIGPDPRAILENGACDMAIGFFPALDGDLHVTKLRSVETVCILRRDSIGEDTPLELAGFLDRPQLCMSLAPGRFTSYTERAVDQLLAGLGAARHRQMSVPSTLAMPGIIANTDMVAIVPADLAARAAETLSIAIRKVPELAFSIDIFLVWHERSDDDPGHAWLRTVIRECAAKLRKHDLTPA